MSKKDRIYNQLLKRSTENDHRHQAAMYIEELEKELGTAKVLLNSALDVIEATGGIDSYPEIKESIEEFLK